MIDILITLYLATGTMAFSLYLYSAVRIMMRDPEKWDD